jgi:hypothetical protein
MQSAHELLFPVARPRTSQAVLAIRRGMGKICATRERSWWSAVSKHATSECVGSLFSRTTRLRQHDPASLQFSYH